MPPLLRLYLFLDKIKVMSVYHVNSPEAKDGCLYTNEVKLYHFPQISLSMKSNLIQSVYFQYNIKITSKYKSVCLFAPTACNISLI